MYNYLVAFVTELKKDFKKLIDNGRLAHGYIFFGHESDEEKFLFGKELANFLENKKWEIGERILNDANFIDASKEAGIDLVRAASQFLWQKPAVSQKRTLIIHKADNLTLPAQNAILKISEEPPPHALIILLVKNPEVLLPAVQSRFQKIFVCGQRDANIRMHTNDTNNKTVKNFLKSSLPKRKEIIQEIVEDDTKLEDFVTSLIEILRQDNLKNWPVLKELLYRWTLINQFNVNKKLQLEAALLELR